MNVSFVIPAFNEEINISNTIKSIVETVNSTDKSVQSYEIIVVNNNSTDGTASIAKKFGAIVVDQPERSISKTRNAGAKNAKYEYIFFLDADTLLTRKLLTNYQAQIQDGKKIVCGISCFDSYGSLTSFGVWIYNVLSLIIKLGVGQAILVEKKSFNKVGGFDEKLFAFEEIQLFKDFKKQFGNSEVKVISTCIKTSGRKFYGNKSNLKFITLLFFAIAGVRVGEKKAQLDFWYGSNNNNNSRLTFSKAATITLIFLLSFDAFFTYTGQKSFDSLAPFISLVIFVTVIIMATRDYKKAVAVIIITLLLEYVGHTTGFPFGSYEYSEMYKNVAVAGVPLFIPIAWYLIGAYASTISKKALVGGAIVLAFDFVIEEFAKAKQIWTWENHEGLLAAPPNNYLAWLVVGTIVCLYLRKSKVDKKMLANSLVIILIYMSVVACTQNIAIGFLGLLFSLFLIHKNKTLVT